LDILEQGSQGVIFFVFSPIKVNRYHDACSDGMLDPWEKLIEDTRARYDFSGALTLVTKTNHRKLHSTLYTIEPVSVMRKLFMAGTV